MWIKWGPGKCVPHSKDFEESVDTTGEAEPEESSGKKTPEWVKDCLGAGDKHSCNKVFALNPTLNCGHEAGLESATLKLGPISSLRFVLSGQAVPVDRVGPRSVRPWPEAQGD